MLEERTVYANGEFIAWGQAKVHIMCHSFGRGSAIFEVLSLHETLSGPAVFRLDEHVHRLYRTAALLDMELPVDKKEFHEAVLETVRRNGARQGFIKIICFYPQISFEICPLKENSTCPSLSLIQKKTWGVWSFRLRREPRLACRGGGSWIRRLCRWRPKQRPIT
jgi:branched-subunit amino acid aminotransferase/4-amino-4-deoxychorismate lyase